MRFTDAILRVITAGSSGRSMRMATSSPPPPTWSPPSEDARCSSSAGCRAANSASRGRSAVSHAPAARQLLKRLGRSPRADTSAQRLAGV
jgi:hypothetical protein